MIHIQARNPSVSKCTIKSPPADPSLLKNRDGDSSPTENHQGSRGIPSQDSTPADPAPGHSARAPSTNHASIVPHPSVASSQTAHIDNLPAVFVNMTLPLTQGPISSCHLDPPHLLPLGSTNVIATPQTSQERFFSRGTTSRCHSHRGFRPV